ncbi:Ras protein [Mycena sanguinolenta]|uniref:Ras protein n=1 Tax=Mycena sanguinolenta TaxID=230812 RepID=A0A8H6Y7E6_9AGAR|nr:Ras protein [Mycena sanguinolenta]
MPAEEWTLTVLGDAGVGKNAISLRFAYEEFIEVPTVFRLRKQLVVDDRLCLVEVTAPGQEASLLDPWVRAGQGFILMYSVASRHSFTQLESFSQTVKRVKGEDDPNPILMLVGNKCDNPDNEREVPAQEGAARAQQLGCEFFETSAKTGNNVDEVFIKFDVFPHASGLLTKDILSVDPAALEFQKKSDTLCVTYLMFIHAFVDVLNSELIP